MMTRNYDDDDDETPAAVWLQVQRQHAERNFVSPMPAPLARREPQTVDQVPQWVTQQQQLDVSSAWQPVVAAQEKTTATDRAKGLLMRLAGFCALYAGAGVVVGLAVWIVAANAPVAALTAVLVFSGLGAGTFLRLNGLDYMHSGAGVERLRITEAADLERARMEHEQELRRAALDAYLKQLEGRNK